MKTTQVIAATLAGSIILTSLVFAARDAVAQSAAAVREEQAQTKSDTSALARERVQLRRDQKALGANSASGRMAAESVDSEKVYKDRQSVNSERKNLARDKSGSLQRKSDAAALQRENKNLKADADTWTADARSGRLAAESTDAQKVYKDRQAIRGEENALTADRANR